MSSALLLLAALALGFAWLRYRSRGLLMFGLAALLLANPVALLGQPGPQQGPGQLEWVLIDACPLAGAALMFVAALRAALPSRRPSMQPLGPRPLTHALLRAVLLLLVSAIVGGLGIAAQDLLATAPQVFAGSAALLVLLAVWALWPLVAACEPRA